MAAKKSRGLTFKRGTLPRKQRKALNKATRKARKTK